MRKIYHKIDQIKGPVVQLKASGIQFGELAYIQLGDGTKTYGQVIKIDNENVALQVFAGSKGISTDDKIQFLGHQVRLSFDEKHLKGRIFNGIGEGIDGKVGISSSVQVEVNGPSFNPAKRVIPSKMIHTGIPMIDMFNTLVESQKNTYIQCGR